MTVLARIDPHAHTSCSDGTVPPEQIIAAAAKADLDLVGITDHDTVSGWNRAISQVGNYLNSRGIPVGLIPGVEISSQARGATVHVLGYLLNPADESFKKHCVLQQEIRLVRAKEIVDILAKDYPISWELVSSIAPAGVPVGRPHIADALVNIKVVPDRSAAFSQILHPRSPYYRKYHAPNSSAVVEMILQAGGVPVLAHPYAGKRQKHVEVDVIGEMVDAGLVALEAYHPEHTQLEVRQVEQVAKQFQILLTGASDWHGAGKPNKLGECVTSPEVWQEIENRGFTKVVRA